MQLHSEFGHFVFDPRWHDLVDKAPNDSISFEFPKTQRQHSLRRIGYRPSYVRIPLSTTMDQAEKNCRLPFGADHLHQLLDRVNAASILSFHYSIFFVPT